MGKTKIEGMKIAAPKHVASQLLVEIDKTLKIARVEKLSAGLYRITFRPERI